MITKVIVQLVFYSTIKHNNIHFVCRMKKELCLIVNFPDGLELIAHITLKQSTGMTLKIAPLSIYYLITKATPSDVTKHDYLTGRMQRTKAV